MDITERIREAGVALGFSRVGFAPAERFDEAADALGQWLGAGHHGQMSYLADQGDRADPRALLPEARSMIVTALPYRPRVNLRSSRDGRPLGAVAGYAQGADYHSVIKDKLWALSRRCREIAGRDVATRVCVDTAPLLEREAARRAGIGFIGKSALCITPGLGSTILLGVLLTDLPLRGDAPIESGCGRCQSCLDACPTGAFVGPRIVDARRCISYLTIEHTGPIPVELRPAIGNRVFGCDVCQDVCPFNAAPDRDTAPELSARQSLSAPELARWLRLGAAQYRKLVRRSALRRTHRAQLARNAAVALGNSGDPAAVPPLVEALERDPHPLVRSHAAWALGRFQDARARAALERARETDDDATVRHEARDALEEATRPLVRQ